MYLSLGDPVAAALVGHVFELSAVDHLPDAPVRYLEDLGGLACGVEVCLAIHAGSITEPGLCGILQAYFGELPSLLKNAMLRRAVWAVWVVWGWGLAATQQP